MEEISAVKITCKGRPPTQLLLHWEPGDTQDCAREPRPQHARSRDPVLPGALLSQPDEGSGILKGVA